MLNSLRRAQKQLKEQTKELEWERKFQIHQLNLLLDHFEPHHPVNILLRYKLQEKKRPRQKYDKSSPAFTKAVEQLSILPCICPSIDMQHYQLELIEKALNFKPAKSKLPEIYSQILDNPYSVFVDLIFSGKDLVTTLSDFPIKKDPLPENDFGDEEPINLKHDLALSNAIFLTHFDLDLFCEQITQEKFSSRMNLKEFAEFEQKFVYRKETSLEFGVVNASAYRFGFKIYLLEQILKQTKSIQQILLSRFMYHPRWSGSYHPCFFSDRPTMMFYPS